MRDTKGDDTAGGWFCQERYKESRDTLGQRRKLCELCTALSIELYIVNIAWDFVVYIAHALSIIRRSLLIFRSQLRLRKRSYCSCILLLSPDSDTYP